MTAPPSGNPGIDDCWNRIGVWGPPSGRCPRLEELIHCHNCEVYAEAARRLRDRPLPRDYPEHWRQHYARPLLRQDTGGRTPVLVFRVGGEWLALPAGTVEEIVDPVPVHGLPHRSGGLLRGIAHIRGRLRVCVSLAGLLGIEGSAGAVPEQRRIYPRMVVIRREKNRFVFSADEVRGFHRHALADLLEVPATLSRSLARFSTGILALDELRIGCLDGALLFHALEKKLA